MGLSQLASYITPNTTDHVSRLGYTQDYLPRNWEESEKPGHQECPDGTRCSCISLMTDVQEMEKPLPLVLH